MTEVLILLLVAGLTAVSFRWPLPEVSKRFTLLLNLQVALMVVITIAASTILDTSTPASARYFQIIMKGLMVWVALLAVTLLGMQARHALRGRNSTPASD